MFGSVDGPSGTLNEFVFGSRIYWPVLFTVPLAAFAFAWAARCRRRAMISLGNPELVARLVASVDTGKRLLAAIAVVLGLTALCFALMRPQYGGKAEVVPASGLDVVLVVDYSKSMLARDVYPSRNERLEAELSRFIEDADRRGDRVGVVVFAGRPRGFPVTRDARMLKLYLDRADPRTENPGGTNIGKALTMAIQFLIRARQGIDDVPVEGPRSPEDIPEAENDQAIVLLTDGEDTESRPLELAQLAAQLGIRIYTVGIGSTSGEPIQKFDEQGEPEGFVTDAEGNYVMTRLDEELLKELANRSGGRYIKIQSERFGLDEVRDMLEALSRSQREDTIQIHREEAVLFAALPALILLSMGLGISDRRRPT
jgi:Ca-activated chloride channel family protein